MKLYNSMGPNPHIARMFAAELGVSLELVEIDLMAGENRESAYLARNPAGQLPALELDDGEIIAESTAICEYLDEPMLNGFRYSEGLPIFQNRMIMIPEAAAGLKNVAQDRLAWLDQQMADGRQFIVGERVTLADVFLYCMLTFGKAVGQPMSPDHTHIAKWYERIAARPSAGA